MARTLIRIAGLTLALGATVVVSWMAVRGVSVFNGPGPLLDPSWFAIWALQAALAGVIGLMAARAWARDTSVGSLIGLISAAWFGELVVVTLLSPLLAGELSLISGPFIWLVATSGLLQPLAAFVGALVGRAWARPPAVSPTL